MTHDRSLEAAIACVADGLAPDWTALEARPPDEGARGWLDSLRLVAGIASFHRSLHEAAREAESRELPSTATAPTSPSDEQRRLGATDLREWGRLRLSKKLGEGGNGEVYRAYDTQLQRHVALKLLLASPWRTSLSRRLLSEGRMLARVRHPNVVSVFGADEHDGRPGLWMELIQGVTLEDLLRSHGLLSASEAALIGQDLCRALAAVHAAGLLHRDVKTRNVMREEGGRIVLMDFGAGGPHGERQLAGTPAYVAPEVLAGSEASMASDIYSLGVVLFRLVTGAYPFPGRQLGEGLDPAEAAGPRPSLRDLRPDLPDAFAKVVEQSLARNPEDRPQTAGLMLGALARALGVEPSNSGGYSLGLRWLRHRVGQLRFSSRIRPLTAGLLGLLTAALVGTAVRPLVHTSKPPLLVRSLAVLPFGEPAELQGQGLGHRLAEDVSRRLNQRGVRAIGGVSSSLAAGFAPHEIGRRLGVDAILRGDLERIGGDFVARLTLAQGTTGTELWSRRYQETEKDAAEMPERVAIDLAEVIGANPNPRFGAHTPNLDAYRAYATGRHYAERRTKESLNLAIRHYTMASDLDPGYAEPWAGSADAHIALGIATFGAMRPQEARRLANQAALKAIELDPHLAEAHTSLAFLSFLYDWDWEAAEHRFQRAIALNPYYAGAHHWYANHLNAMGRQTEAMQEFEKAVELEPLSILIQRDRGWHLFNQRRYSEAAQSLRGTLAIQSDYTPARSLLGRVLIEARLYPEGILELEKAASQTPPSTSLPLLAYAHAAAGNRALAERQLVQLQQLSAESYVAPYYIALVHLRLGNIDETFQWLEKAFQEQDTSLVNLKIDPRLDRLRGMPRYEALLERMKFPRG